MKYKLVLQKMAQLIDELRSSEVAKDYLRLKMDRGLKDKMIAKYFSYGRV